MKTIVAPTDFSPVSRNAVYYAADLAKLIGTNLTLMHVHQFPVSFGEIPIPAYDIGELEHESAEQLKQLKREIVMRVGTKLKIRIVIKGGDMLTEIEKFCKSVDPYAVVMGAETVTGLERFLLGGKTVTALQNLRWPVIVVPANMTLSGIRKIGFACDLQNVLETIPDKEIKELVSKFKAELHVLHISDESGKPFGPQEVSESVWLQEILAELNPAYHFLEGKDIESRLIEFAEKNKLDLLIVVPKKHSWINRIFQHSCSKRLVLHARVPVIAFHGIDSNK